MRVDRVVWVFCMVGGALAGSGCRDREEGPKYRNMKGRVVSVNTGTGEVEMSCYIAKQGKTMNVRGKLAPEAEIQINGSTARLEDVQSDDQVEVTGYMVKGNGQAEPQWVATKVSIERGRISSGSAPATQTGPG